MSNHTEMTTHEDKERVIREDDAMIGSTADPEIIQFVRMQLKRQKPFDRFVLAQSSDQSNRIASWEDEHGDLAGKSPTQIGVEIWEAATTDAKTMRDASVRYVILAYFKGEDVYDGRKFFRMEGGAHYSDGLGSGNEEATEKGVLAQHMRFTETVLRMNLDAQQQMLKLYQRRIVDMEEQQSKRDQLALKTFELFQSLQDRAQDREIELTKVKNKEIQKAKLIDKFSPLVPLLLGKVVPGLGDPAEMSKMLAEEQLGAVLGSLEPDQLMKIASILNEGQRGALMSLYKAYGERSRKEKEKTEYAEKTASEAKAVKDAIDAEKAKQAGT